MMPVSAPPGGGPGHGKAAEPGVRWLVMDASNSMARAREEGLARLDAALAGMGSDPCVASLPLVVEEIAGQTGADSEQQRVIRLALNERLGLHPEA
jgi:hypothetical protein